MSSSKHYLLALQTPTWTVRQVRRLPRAGFIGRAVGQGWHLARVGEGEMSVEGTLRFHRCWRVAVSWKESSMTNFKKWVFKMSYQISRFNLTLDKNILRTSLIDIDLMFWLIELAGLPYEPQSRVEGDLCTQLKFALEIRILAVLSFIGTGQA